MNITFTGEPEDVPYMEEVGWTASVDGRPLYCRFTRDAIRSVMPLPADKGDLRARVASHRDVFAGLVGRKLAALKEVPAELTISAADVPRGS